MNGQKKSVNKAMFSGMVLRTESELTVVINMACPDTCSKECPQLQRGYCIGNIGGSCLRFKKFKNSTKYRFQLKSKRNS